MRVYTDWKEMEERTPVIRFRNADIFNGENCVIYGLDMDVYPGDFIYIVGKVGTGKTSIIRTIIAENPLVKGEGTVCGYDITSIRPKDIPFLRRRLGVVFQDFQLLMDRSVEENLAFVLKATGWKEGAEFYSRIDEVLAAVGMTHDRHSKVHPQQARSDHRGRTDRQPRSRDCGWYNAAAQEDQQRERHGCRDGDPQYEHLPEI